ncbi:MAG: HipA N-terminal domain-containing protein [Opitutales bacterium]
MSDAPIRQAAEVHKAGQRAGCLTENVDGQFIFTYDTDYTGPPISLALPVREAAYTWSKFPPFFDGLLPEGAQLDALLRTLKVDRHDYFAQILAVGEDLVGDVTVHHEA